MSGGRIELIDRTPYTLYREIADKLEGFELVCRTGGLSDSLQEMRGVKDEQEIEIYRRAGEMTNRMIESLCAALEDGSIKTEAAAAMFVESESRRLGAEGSSFETLAAGPARSWGIHAFPAFTAGAVTGTAAGLEGGLSIIDCGLKLEGLCTDITLTVCTGSLSSRQEEMTGLVAGAHKLAAETAGPGVTAAAVARAVDNFFKDAGYTMPHGLGHGLGLDVHEYPYLKDVEIYDKPLLPGMVFTIEPGLYDSEAGGVRLENDYLMTENGAEALTASRILMLPRG
jgi:Xaa-Pro dipeptidase